MDKEGSDSDDVVLAYIFTQLKKKSIGERKKPYRSVKHTANKTVNMESL